MEHFIETFLRIVKENEDKSAVSDEFSTFTYGELLNYGLVIAANLRAKGAGPKSRIIVEIPRSKEYAGALLGCWFCGAVAIPLSDDYPEERLLYIKNDSKCELTINSEFIKAMDMSMTTEPYIGELSDEGIVIYTSGSTGNPKGVIHDFYSIAAVIDRNISREEADDTEKNDIAGLVAPFTFIVGISLFLAAMSMAKHLYIVSDEIRRDPYKLAAYYDENNIESSFIPPRMVDFMLQHNSSLKFISVGSERIRDIFFDGNPVVVNGYGSTETFGAILAFAIDKKYDNTPIGKPVGEEKAYVLDDNNQEVVTGELCISGYLAKGYLNREKETKRVFVKNPFKEIDGYDRMFRTGDIVTRLDDGNLVFVERKDWMIKINGQRVEPGEVEGTIRRFPGIKEAVIRDFTAKNGITYLAAYYTSEESISPEKLKEYCTINLTSYMVPSFYIQMDKLPINPNGKLDRKNLPEPDFSAYKSEYVKPLNKLEEALCKAFEKVLSCENVGRNDDFFLLGGDSVKAMEAINMLDDLPLDAQIFIQGRTPALIAKLIENGGADEPEFDRVERSEYPLTTSQLGVYLEAIQKPESLMYNNPISITLSTDVDSKRLIDAVARAVNNHKAYHCSIDIQNKVPCMVPDDRQFSVQHKNSTDIEADLREFVQPFDLSGKELIRACLFENEHEKVLALDAHHVVFDGTTLSILLSEIEKIYDGVDIYEERTSAFDLSAYEDALQKTDRYEKAREFYTNKFSDIDISNDFTCDFPDKGKSTLATVNVSVTPNKEELLKFIKSNNLTENSLFLAAFSYVLCKYNGTDQALVSVGESGRHTSMTFNTAGMLVKTLVIPSDLTVENSVSDYICGLQKDFSDCVANDIFPFSEVVKQYSLSTDFSFVYQGNSFSTLKLSKKEYPVVGIENPDAMNKLTLMVFKDEDSYRLSFRYRSDLFAEEIIKAFADATCQVVNEFLTKEYLSELELLSTKQEEVLDSFCDSKEVFEQKTVMEFFQDQVRSNPKHELVVCGDKHISYEEADTIANKIAGFIVNLGMKPNDVAAVLIPRNEWIVLATYGILKAGCAYEPLDSSYPSERLSFMVENSGAKLLVTTHELEGRINNFSGPRLYLEDVMSLKEASMINVKNSMEDLFILLYTSGTTGNPKGAMLTQGNVSALAQIARKRFNLGKDTVNACYASYGFDACMMDLVTIPANGGTIHIISEDIRLDLKVLDAYYTKNKITHAFMTTQVGRQYALLTKSPYLKYLFLGGEVLIPLDTSGFSFDICNGYGPTECTAFVATQIVKEHSLRIPIGTINPYDRGYVVDRHMNRLPIGAPGELLIAGRQVSKGYINLPEKTKDAYLDNPFSKDEAYSRVYRTGDIVRFLPDGRLDFIGRHDDQVKIRGFRIELSEVEEVIRRFDGIKDATVVAYTEPAGGKYLAAYVVSDEKVDIDDLYSFIKSEKPVYMVPAVTMQIDKIPLNQNQKVNRKALPVPEFSSAEVVEPKTELQKKIFDIVKNVIGHAGFGIDTDIYEAGLTSIGSVRLNVELSEAFSVPVKITDLAENRTIRELEEFLSEGTVEEVFEIQEDYPITQTQMGIYIECVGNPNSVTYNIPLLVKLDSTTDINKLASAVEKAIDAHPYLKTELFADKDGNIRAKRDDEKKISVEIIKCDKQPKAEELVYPFTLLGSPLCRVSIYETNEGNYFFMDCHHIVMDGVSENIFIDAIDKAYCDREIKKERYTGFEAALLEEKNRASERFEEAKEYYDGIFRGCDANCLPPKAARASEQGAKNVMRTADTAVSSVTEYCRKHGFTENAFFNAAFAYTLNFFSNFEEAVYTTIYNGRSDSRLSLCVTMLVKTLPMLVRVSENSDIAELIGSTQEQLINTMSHDIYSFAEISAAYGIHSDILFVYQGEEFNMQTFCGKEAEFIKVLPDVAKAPITVTVNLKAGKYILSADYESSMFNESLISSMLKVFDLVLCGFTEKEKTDDISVLKDEQKTFLSRINDTAFPFKNIPASRLFEEHVLEAPDTIALICGEEKLTYKELNDRANRFAARLISLLVQKDTVVGVLLERSSNLVVAELSILKAGGAFLPMLPEYPDDRIRYCLKDSKSPFVITTEKIKNERKELFTSDAGFVALTVEELMAGEAAGNPEKTADTSDLAYCIYTSGSTGNPKGVMIEHHGLSNFVQTFCIAREFCESGNTAQTEIAMGSVSFDIHIPEILLPLSQGKTVVVAKEADVHNPIALSKLILDNKVDVMLCTPSFLTNLLGNDCFEECVRQLKILLVGAEVFSPELYELLYKIAPDIHIYNGYGPTECTVSSSAKLLSPSEEITIGSPAPNFQYLIMDKTGRILPPYALGELIILGEGVGRGYVNLPEKTKASYFEVEGVRAYHSGDLARFNEKGEIEFAGRLDNQVKLRGYRVELDEIEAAICAFSEIKQAKVVVRNNGSEDYLVGFFTAGKEIDTGSLSAYLKSRLTYYMVPDILMQLEAMPLTPSGKIDKKALPEVKKERKSKGRKAPKKSLEQELCELYAKALVLDEVYADDSFFELGGTSLSASKVIMQLMSKGIEVQYQDIFDHPTPEELADYIGSLNSAKKKDEFVEDNSSSPVNMVYSEQLKYNSLEYAEELTREPLGDVVLTGAVGFLGIHILRELLESEEGKIYCLIRRGSFASPERRLRNMLIYYFDDPFEELVESRVNVIEADVTDNVTEVLKDISFDTIINCAACVKHYAADDILERINVGGVENLIKSAVEKNARMIQISTVSIPGVHTAETFKMRVKMYEDRLFVIDDMGNKYSISKYHAELKMLEAIKNGLRGKIIRVGNLMGRHKDGEFQINFNTNAFLSALRGFAVIGKSPASHMTDVMSFSPIDMTARAVVLLAGTNDMFTAFSADSRFLFDERQLIEAANHVGIKITPVPDKEYYADYHRLLADTKENQKLQGLMTNDRPDLHGVESDNTFTTNILYRLGFSWPLPDIAYLERALESLMTLDYFEDEEV